MDLCPCLHITLPFSCVRSTTKRSILSILFYTSCHSGQPWNKFMRTLGLRALPLGTILPLIFMCTWYLLSQPRFRHGGQNGKSPENHTAFLLCNILTRFVLKALLEVCNLCYCCLSS